MYMLWLAIYSQVPQKGLREIALTRTSKTEHAPDGRGGASLQ